MSGRILVLLMLCVSLMVAGQSKGGRGAVERQRREAASTLKKSSARLESNRKATAQRLAQLSALTAEIEELDAAIAGETREIALMDTAIAGIEDTIAQLDAKIADMSEKYAKALRGTRRVGGHMSELMFVFASDEFGQMWRRYRNMRQFAQWRARRAEEIGKSKAELEERKTELDRMKVSRVVKMKTLEESREALKGKQRDNDRLLGQLRREQRQIRSIISEKQREINSLDRELDRLIAEEQARAEAEAAKAAKAAAARQSAKKPAASKNTQAGKKTTESAGDGGDSGHDLVKETETAEEMVTVVKTDEKGEATTRRTASQLSAGFKSSRGRLPWPVEGKFRVLSRFGRHKHPSLPMVETDNPGIDVGVTSGRWAKAIYEGVVSAVFRQPGYSNIVMIRHGDYITVYANLETISVGKGDRVGAGQPLGVVALDEDNSGMRVLHFEIRREKVKENPEAWLK